MGLPATLKSGQQSTKVPRGPSPETMRGETGGREGKSQRNGELPPTEPNEPRRRKHGDQSNDPGGTYILRDLNGFLFLLCFWHHALFLLDSGFRWGRHGRGAGV